MVACSLCSTTFANTAQPLQINAGAFLRTRVIPAHLPLLVMPDLERVAACDSFFGLCFGANLPLACSSMTSSPARRSASNRVGLYALWHMRGTRYRNKLK